MGDGLEALQPRGSLVTRLTDSMMSSRLGIYSAVNLRHLWVNMFPCSLRTISHCDTFRYNVVDFIFVKALFHVLAYLFLFWVDSILFVTIKNVLFVTKEKFCFGMQTCLKKDLDA